MEIQKGKRSISINSFLLFIAVVCFYFLTEDIILNNLNSFIAVGLVCLCIGEVNIFCYGLSLVFGDNLKIQPLFYLKGKLVNHVIFTVCLTLIGSLFYNGWVTEFLLRFVFK